jgi:uncharacterized membrane protein YbaN (DUF454 family)
MALFTWLFIGIVGAFGATLLTCNFILMATECERPRWYIAIIRTIGRRIGLEL